MESLDKLITVSKHLFDHRVADQRREIEYLKKITPSNLYLCKFTFFPVLVNFTIMLQ